MKIETIEISKINPAVYNPRKDLKTGDPEYEHLKKSINEFGLIDPLIWNKRTGNLVGGHQRLKILKERGDKEVEVSVVDFDDAKEKALNIALNKISGDWDMPLLKDLLEELDTGDFDMDLTGFTSKEIEDLMNQCFVPEEGLTDDDAIPENVETICKKGDLWKLGEHRLLCGDSTVITDVERLMQGEKADMVFTDPPYGIDYKKKSNKQTVTNDGSEFEKILQMAILNISSDCPKYICGDFRTCEKLKRACSSMGEPSNLIVWEKPIQQRLHKWEYCHEFIWFYGNNGSGFIDGNVWECSREINSLHPTIKPVELIQKAILAHKSGIVLDLFGGSGSTLIACEKLNRKCRMMEIDEHYCDVIIKRWEDFTGKKAELIKG